MIALRTMQLAIQLRLVSVILLFVSCMCLNYVYFYFSFVAVVIVVLCVFVCLCVYVCIKIDFQMKTVKFTSRGVVCFVFKWCTQIPGFVCMYEIDSMIVQMRGFTNAITITGMSFYLNGKENCYLVYCWLMLL